MIHRITPSADYNQWLKRLDSQLNKPPNQNIMKGPKVMKLTNEKTIFKKTFGTSVIKSSIVPFLPDKNTFSCTLKDINRHFNSFLTVKMLYDSKLPYVRYTFKLKISFRPLVSFLFLRLKVAPKGSVFEEEGWHKKFKPNRYTWDFLQKPRASSSTCV